MTEKQFSNLSDTEKFDMLKDSRNISSKLVEIETSIKRVELALVGNPSLGQTGLVERINYLEAQVEKMREKFFIWGGIVTGIVFALEFVLNYAAKLFGG